MVQLPPLVRKRLEKLVRDILQQGKDEGPGISFSNLGAGLCPRGAGRGLGLRDFGLLNIALRGYLEKIT